MNVKSKMSTLFAWGAKWLRRVQPIFFISVANKLTWNSDNVWNIIMDLIEYYNC